MNSEKQLLRKREHRRLQFFSFISTFRFLRLFRVFCLFCTIQQCRCYQCRRFGDQRWPCDSRELDQKRLLPVVLIVATAGMFAGNDGLSTSTPELAPRFARMSFQRFYIAGVISCEPHPNVAPTAPTAAQRVLQRGIRGIECRNELVVINVNGTEAAGFLTERDADILSGQSLQVILRHGSWREVLPLPFRALAAQRPAQEQNWVVVVAK